MLRVALPWKHFKFVKFAFRKTIFGRMITYAITSVDKEVQDARLLRQKYYLL